MSSFTSLDPKRLGSLVGAFSAAFFDTPESDDFAARIRMTLKALPDDVVRELGEAVDVMADLARERLDERSGKVLIEYERHDEAQQPESHAVLLPEPGR